MSRNADGPLVLVLPGGKPRSHALSRPWHLSVVRAAWLARSLSSRLASVNAHVRVVRYHYRGWNAPGRDPVHDARRMLERILEREPARTVVLVGHSMGGRAAVHLAGILPIAGVVALAPWWPDDDPEQVPQDQDTALFTVHGTADTWTDPEVSRRRSEQARARGVDALWLPMEGAGHFMLVSARRWHVLTADLVRKAAAVDPHPKAADDA